MILFKNISNSVYQLIYMVLIITTKCLYTIVNLGYDTSIEHIKIWDSAQYLYRVVH